MSDLIERLRDQPAANTKQSPGIIETMQIGKELSTDGPGTQAGSAGAEPAPSADSRLRGLGEQPAVPVLWLRTINGKPDWAEDCVDVDAGTLLEGYEEDSGYAVMPLYAAGNQAAAKK